MDLDLKSMVLGSVVGLAAGGGLYGLYVKYFGEAVLVQGQTYGLVGECATHLNSSSSLEIEDFLLKVKGKQNQIDKSDAVITSVNLAMGEKRNIPAGMGRALALCVSELESDLEILRAREKS
ncbi:hypothetical protein [Shewanella baltica]|uniref:hypothetical protein n=1 Tax=Shewanella baltica TaxID=62322 RepID=UPI0021698107|nr:hypothetical protein [Shewanella baltica]MCS6117297.1 hypothetical protein [Shewanella baltica]UVW63575.1 hypothetical protein HHE93_08200 [Shewanella baltica]